MPDVQQRIVDLLTAELDDIGQDATVSVGVPTDWAPSSSEHIEVAWDGTPELTWPVAIFPTVRLVARAHSTSAAKRLASLAQGLLAAYGGGDDITSIRPLTGVLPARDPETEAEIASVTMRVAVRSEPAVSGS